jgi:hypothetical protein
MGKRHGLGFHEEVLEYYQQIRDNDDVPLPTKEAVIFKSTNEPKGTYTFYFSPDAARTYAGLIQHYNGEKCFQPSKSEAVKYVGPKDGDKLLAD